MQEKDRELLERIAKQNEEILKNQKELIGNTQQKTAEIEDPYYTNHNRERAKRGILS